MANLLFNVLSSWGSFKICVEDLYWMSLPKLTELKMQLQVLLDKNYITPSVSLWGELVLLSKRKWYIYAMHRL